MNSGEVDCLADSGTTHTILRYQKYFINFTPKVTSVTTILGPSTLIEGFGKAKFALSNGTSVTISEALYSPRSSCTLLSFKDIRANEYHVVTAHANDVDFLYMTSNTYG